MLTLATLSLFFSLALSAPAKLEERQLAGLEGILGIDATFDYVIVGGGTAGLTLAERLTENPAVTVAVIEAGFFYQITNPLLSQTPAGDVIFSGSDPTDTNPLVDWNFVTAPQAGANGRQIHYARGKCLGGSSARNYMIYQRPDTGSLQQWADAVGDQSYNFANFLPYYKKSVKFTPPAASRAANASAEYNPAAYTPVGGPLDISYANYAGPFSSWMELGLNAIGLPDAQDFNSGTLNGAQYCTSTISPGSQTRESSQTAFLTAANGRSNLKVYTVTRAQKILFDSSKTATGVRASSAGFSDFTLTARREVLLTAGAFQSPQLLMLSGVGPAAALRALNIPVVADRPGVGQNMTDHVFFGPSYRVNVQTFTRLANDPLYVGAQFIGPYSILKQGPLTNPVCDYLGWEKTPRNLLTAAAATSLARFPPSWPELEYLSAPGYVGDFGNLLLDQPKDGYQYATILAGIVAPLSRGTVTLASADPNALPIINPNWLTDPTDQAVGIAGYKRVRQAFASAAMRPVLADRVEYFPGPSVQTDAQILNTIRNTVMTIWHASCTNRMGRRDDPTAVVDSNARVIGVNNLRVVDASSFALLPPGHPQSTVYAFAEKIAAQILAGR